MKAVFSYFLIAAGAVLLFLGARVYIESRLGQQEAAREFEEPEAVYPQNIPTPRPRTGDSTASWP